MLGSSHVEKSGPRFPPAAKSESAGTQERREPIAKQRQIAGLITAALTHRYSETVIEAPASPEAQSPGPTAPVRKRTPRWFLRTLMRWAAIAAVALWSVATVMLVAVRWIDPPTTAVQMERRVQAWMGGGGINRKREEGRAKAAPLQENRYQKRYEFVPLSQISPDLQHAVIAAEDARFYQHHGFDWQAIQKAAEDDLEGGRIRGGSTITQQLVKNLFFGTGRSILRKGAEFTLVPVAEFVLSKRRILELYLNVVEWAPGMYGAEAACRYYYREPARSVGREDSARLAAILPLPLKRRPERMNRYSAIILERMRQAGW